MRPSLFTRVRVTGRRSTLKCALLGVEQRQAIGGRAAGRDDDQLLESDRCQLPIAPGHAVEPAT